MLCSRRARFLASSSAGVAPRAAASIRALNVRKIKTGSSHPATAPINARHALAASKPPTLQPPPTASSHVRKRRAPGRLSRSPAGCCAGRKTAGASPAAGTPIPGSLKSCTASRRRLDCSQACPAAMASSTTASMIAKRTPKDGIF